MHAFAAAAVVAAPAALVCDRIRNRWDRMSVFQPVATIIYALHYMHSTYEFANVIFYIKCSARSFIHSQTMCDRSTKQNKTSNEKIVYSMFDTDGDGGEEREKKGSMKPLIL